MKKKLLAAVLCGAMALSLVACGGSGSGAGNDKNEKPARKVVKQISYDYTTGEKQTEVETHYDKNGRETYKKNIAYNVGPDQNETMETEIEYKWVEEGNTATANYQGTTHTYTYDEDGNKIKQVVKTLGYSTEYVYTYKNGVMATQVQKMIQHDQVMSILEVEFDSRGNMSKYVQKDGTGKILTSYDQTYEYDEKGNIISYTLKVQGSNGESMELKYDYIYDAKGFLDKVEVGGVVMYDYTCDSKGNIIEVKNYNGEILTSETYYEYYEN